MGPNEQKTPSQPQIQETVDRLDTANNVLVTVSNNPSLDQLAACIGLTLALNKKGKHATAVFSGQVPSAIEFLEPDKTLEKNTDSLRDFIISLDKSKADKLRYKVEDSVVKIFITPYRTSISEDDLEFSQGDFNVDAVVALGVHSRNDLDTAILAHGRILHDATIISVNTLENEELGSIHWLEKGASSLSEMVADLIQRLDNTVLDAQIATALLTGIVSETDRFRNEKSSPHTMTISGVLMSAGASTQLVSSQLEKPMEVHHDDQGDSEDGQEGSESTPDQLEDDAGTIHIDHDDSDIHIDDTGRFSKVSDILREIDEEAQREQANQDQAQSVEAPPTSLPEPGGDVVPDAPVIPGEPPAPPTSPSLVYEPPTFGGQLTANTDAVDQQYISNPDPLTSAPPSVSPTLSHSEPPVIQPQDSTPQTLSDLEKSLNSPHASQYEDPAIPRQQDQVSQPPAPPIEPDYARDAVERAVQASSEYRPEPIQALGATPFEMNGNDNGNGTSPPPENPTPPQSPPPPVPPPFNPNG